MNEFPMKCHMKKILENAFSCLYMRAHLISMSFRRQLIHSIFVYICDFFYLLYIWFSISIIVHFKDPLWYCQIFQILIEYYYTKGLRNMIACFRIIFWISMQIWWEMCKMEWHAVSIYGKWLKKVLKTLAIFRETLNARIITCGCGQTFWITLNIWLTLNIGIFSLEMQILASITHFAINS